MKGDVVATVMAVAIIVTSSLLVVNMISPILQESEILQSYNKAKQTLTEIDAIITELMFEAPGAVRNININAKGGDIIISGKEDRVKFRMRDVSVVDPGTMIKEGKIEITSGPSIKAYETDINNDGITELVLENDALVFGVRKYGNSSNYVPINTTNMIPFINNQRVGVNVTPISGIFIDGRLDSSFGTGYSEITIKGQEMESSGIMLYMNTTSFTYEVLFTLSAGADFIEVEVKHIKRV